MKLLSNILKDKQVNQEDRIYQSHYDEIKRIFQSVFVLSFNNPKEEVWEALLKTSLQGFKVSKEFKVDSIKINKVFYDKNRKKYVVDNLKIYELYSLKCKIEQDQYWTIYQFKSGNSKKSDWYYIQKVKYHKTIGGAPGLIAKHRFKRNVKLRGRHVQNVISRQLKLNSNK